MTDKCVVCAKYTCYCECHNNYKREWGFHNLMVLAAFRYCLGRRSYIVGSCVYWLMEWWDEIDQNTKMLILEETQDAINKNHAGDKCDTDDWQKLLKYAAHKIDSVKKETT